MSRDDSLLGRWSQRKRAVAAEAASETPVQSPATPLEEDPQIVEEPLSEPELLEQLGLPDPDTLSEGDDFKVFLQSHIPAALRQRALRRLWRSNPVLANLDGLIDHGEDYTDAATVPDVLTTAYKVGRGFLKDILDTPPPPDQDAETDPPVLAESPPSEQQPEPAEPGKEPTPEPAAFTFAPDLPPEAEDPKPRRMSFHKS